eukprot:g18237.t1
MLESELTQYADGEAQQTRQHQRSRKVDDSGRDHSSEAIGLSAPEAKYDVLLLQFADGVIVTLEEAQDGHVTQRVRGGVNMVRNQKVLLFVVYGAQMLDKMVFESTLGLPDIEEATSGTADAVDELDRYAGESLSNVEGLVYALNG